MHFIRRADGLGEWICRTWQFNNDCKTTQQYYNYTGCYVLHCKTFSV